MSLESVQPQLSPRLQPKATYSSVATFQQLASTEVSHDNYFHTVPGMLEINPGIYKPELDLIRH